MTTHEMPVWPSFLDQLGARSVFARIDVGFSPGDTIEFVCETRRETRRVVRKEPCVPSGWVLLTVEK